MSKIKDAGMIFLSVLSLFLVYYISTMDSKIEKIDRSMKLRLFPVEDPGKLIFKTQRFDEKHVCITAQNQYGQLAIDCDFYNTGPKVIK